MGKVFVVSNGNDRSIWAHLLDQMDNQEVTIITPAEAKSLARQSTPKIDSLEFTVLNRVEFFKKPLTRKERRIQARKKLK